MQLNTSTPLKSLFVLFAILLIGGMAALKAQTPPVAVNDTIRLCEGTTVLLDVLANDSDVDGDDLETDILAGPASILIDYDDDGLPEGQYWISIEPGFTGEDFMVYEVCGDDDDLCDIGIIVIIVAGAEGCVWPGDANQDSICNYIDLLPIGLYYGLIGPDRDDDDGSWEESFCDEWADDPGITAPNPKFADCNGDGLIDAADTTVISTNYGELRGTYVPAETIGGPDDPEMYFGLFSDTLDAGTIVTIPIYLGTDLHPASNLYGMAFEIAYDTALVDESSVVVDFTDSWLGTTGSDMLFLQNNVATEGRIEVAVSRNNQIPRTGAGYFAQVSFVMEDNIAGKVTGQIASTAEFCITLPNAISAAGTPVPVQITCDSVVLIDNTNDIPSTTDPSIRIYPNPANDKLNIQLPAAGEESYVTLKTVTGQLIYQKYTQDQMICVPTHNIPSGTYLLNITSENSTHTHQLIIQH